MSDSKPPRSKVQVQKLKPMAAAIASHHIPGESAARKADDKPKIVFPCDYPIRVLGDAADDYLAVVAEVVSRHAPEFDPACMTVKNSSKSRFMSVTLTIRATGESQLKALFEDLKATGRVKMVI